MKKSLSLLVAIAMVFSMFAAVASAAEKQSAGEYLQEIGVIKGNLEGNLNEDKEWKREDLTVLLSRLLGVEKAASEHANNHGFTDVTNSFYDGYISWAKAEGLMEGKGNDKFGYNDPLTNQQFAAVVLRALKIEAAYDDVPTVAVEKKLVAEGTDFKANALRGVTYEVIVTALNTEVTGTGKKLGTILGLKGFEIKELALESVLAPSRANVVLSFNTEVGEAKATNFSVYEKDNQYAIKTIDKVAVAGNKVTLTLIDTLAEDKEYVVAVSNLVTKAGDFTLDSTTKEFKYVAQAPASISFGRTSVATESNVPVVIKDANGNDITANYSIPGDLEVQSSATDKVGTDLKAGTAVGFAVVNVKLVDTTLETGNTIINVKSTLSNATSFGKVGIGNIDDQKLDIFVGDNTQKLNFQVLDQDGNVLEEDEFEASFRSLNPTVLVVNQEGEITPVNTGTASVTITAKDEVDGKQIQKTVTITVKAAPKATSIKVEASNSKLVIDSGIAQTVKFEVLDQYGNTFKPTSPEITEIKYSINKAGLAAGHAKDEEKFVNIDGGKAEIVLNPADVDDATSGTLKVSYGTSFTKSISVSLVKAGNFAGYAAVAGDTTLDLNDIPNDNRSKGPISTGIKVYQKDVNGNYISDVTATADLAHSDKGFVTVAGQTVTSAKVGTENVIVKINEVRIATIAFTVVNTKPTLTTVSQNNNAVNVNVGDDLATKLFGPANSTDGGVFVGYDQYGSKSDIRATEVQVISSNTGVVNQDLNASTAGEAVLTLKIADKFYTIVIKVKA